MRTAGQAGFERSLGGLMCGQRATPTIPSGEHKIIRAVRLSHSSYYFHYDSNEIKR
ncbi:hypothetical protein SAMN05661044_02253 [Olivibacter domesticus]|uniref:Uncharacterized protein n=1 Tax=Olivibacter domesticus TaxID=407022 RepID=A0A1H7PIH0_OLID1|nr:hypothetical protein SAMN05661044_02253 [Olivibacter domesticus]